MALNNVPELFAETIKNSWVNAFEGFESDKDNDYNSTHKCRLKKYIYLNIVIIVDEEAQERDIFNLTAVGKPNNYSFDGSEWTKQVTQIKFTNIEIQ